MEHIQHCLEQLERFSRMFKNGNVDNKWERITQFGYNLGRLVVFLKKHNFAYELNPMLSEYSISMAKFVIKRGIIKNEYIEYNIIDFGFAIGFIQEILKQSHNTWWKPIAPYCANENWSKVETITKELLDKEFTSDVSKNYFTVFDHEKELKWDKIYDNVKTANNQITKLIFKN